jgi:dTDP-4-amino-4,6-dideoxygalactose transaminase
MNEFQAGFGLVQLNYVKDYIAKRKEIAGYYNKILDEIPGIKVYKPAESIDYTYTYYPILVEESEYGKSRDHLYKNLVSATVENLPVANKIADKILCLPIYSNLQFKEIDFIVDIVKKR